MVLAGGLALAACSREAEAVPSAAAVQGGLKDHAPFPVGAAIRSDLLAEPAYPALVRTHFDQITADWEMKMEAVLEEDGAFDFSRADLVADFARSHGLRLFGHTLIWNEQRPAFFEALKDNRSAFARAYGRYIAEVVSRYRGARGWDVVNEPFNWNGSERRGGIWAETLGEAYIPLAFERARAADPEAVLFLNDYNLEQFPAKRRAFLNLAEGLLKAGVPLGGLGTQTHLNHDTDPGSLGPAMRELGSLGLPVHLSELDFTLKGAGRDRMAALALQARLAGATAEAFASLPEAQRFAFTTWGVRDKDSWLRQPEQEAEFPNDQPLLLDDAGRPKSAFAAVVEAWG
ncbi:MAG: endo-1,4-beta-xylanase [Proteobacteria bacterium]|nr:endo-1,4-beta-xylanase [Pseudomonadota bacterium]MBW3617983.1 endo-1,4-beta-xylanase [Pseudomonadota bacterium]